MYNLSTNLDNSNTMKVYVV